VFHPFGFTMIVIIVVRTSAYAALAVATLVAEPHLGAFYGLIFVSEAVEVWVHLTVWRSGRTPQPHSTEPKPPISSKEQEDRQSS
jgi:hypothetical protein